MLGSCPPRVVVTGSVDVGRCDSVRVGAVTVRDRDVLGVFIVDLVPTRPEEELALAVRVQVAAEVALYETVFVPGDGVGDQVIDEPARPRILKTVSCDGPGYRKLQMLAVVLGPL